MLRIYYPFFLSPCCGAHYVNLDHIRTLRRWGFDAYVYFLNKKEEATGFDDIPVLFDEDGLLVDKEDVLILPENAVGLFKQSADLTCLFSQMRIVMHNQNQLYHYACGSVYDFNTHPMQRIIVPSEYAARRLQEAGIRKPINVVRPFIPDIFTPKVKSRTPIKIVYTSRKRNLDIHNVKFYFNAYHQGEAELQFIDMTGISRHEVAELMSTAAIYLSFAQHESLGLMALEAMASGCHVVGFTGINGGYCEYFNKKNGDWIEEGDYLNFARKLSEAIELFISKQDNPKIQAGFDTINQFFKQHHFEQALKSVYEKILDQKIV